MLHSVDEFCLSFINIRAFLCRFDNKPQRTDIDTGSKSKRLQVKTSPNWYQNVPIQRDCEAGSHVLYQFQVVNVGGLMSGWRGIRSRVSLLLSKLGKHGSSVDRHLPLVLELGPRLDPPSRRGKFRCPNTLSLVSFEGMTLGKCIIIRIGTLTGCLLCRESHPLCRLKYTTVI